MSKLVSEPSTHYSRDHWVLFKTFCHATRKLEDDGRKQTLLKKVEVGKLNMKVR